MRNLTWKEFSDLIKIGYRQIIEEDYNITTEAGFYAMKTTNYEFRGKIIFDKKVNFQGVKLKFSNVEFKDDLNIDSLSN